MVSRRNFFSICIMMATIFMLFQASVLIRDLGNQYNVNEYLTETRLTRTDSWTPDKTEVPAETVVYIGSGEKTLAEMIRQWGNYAKRRVVQYDSLEEYDPRGEDAPALLCVAGSEISTLREVSVLRTLANRGQSIVFCDLPEPAVLESLPAFCSLLGIQEIVREEVELTGVKLFSGFLLGGEAIYQATNEKEEKMQDLELLVPWYRPLWGTKTYMVGLLEEDPETEIENEDLPGLIWRNSYGDARIFAVNGSYMYDQTGLGILSAILYELRGYELHPVVNAQNLSVVSFPDLAMENTEILTEIYARDMKRLQMDLLWPGLIAAANKGNYRMSCLLAPQMDYTTQEAQFSQDLIFYLKQFKEQGTEAGLSLDYLPGIDLRGKLERDREFFENSGSEYKYGAAYVSKEDAVILAELAREGTLDSIRTTTGLRKATDALFSYSTDTILDQGVTADGFSHTYSQDLRVRAVETALGYSNILLDMKYVTWPEEDAPHWEVLSEDFSSNINTYWHPFSVFDKTTLLESDERARTFLAMDYTDSRNGDSITVAIHNRSGDAWFLLRTHSESISDITGGTYQQMEEDVYLIRAREDHLEISVEPDVQLVYSLS